MSSNAALSAARRRRSNPVPSGPTTNMQPPPVNRILQRTGVPPPQHAQQQPPFNPRMPPPQQVQGQMRHPTSQGQMQSKGRQQQQPLSQSMARPQSSLSELPPLPPPVKTAGPLYGIPIHPLLMFKTHDNKLSEHELSIGDCFEQLKEIEERLVAFESSNGVATTGEVASSGDLNELMNDGVFINGIVDNIMNTTNFASIVENVIPLKEENEALKQQVEGLNEKVEGLNEQVEGLHGKLEEWKERMQQLENQVRSICSGASHISSDAVVAEEAVPNYEKCTKGEEGKCEEES
jgi:hypothetical protein